MIGLIGDDAKVLDLREKCIHGIVQSDESTFNTLQETNVCNKFTRRGQLKGAFLVERWGVFVQ